MSVETHLSTTALVLLARAGLDLHVLDNEIEFAEIERTCKTEEEAA